LKTPKNISDHRLLVATPTSPPKWLFFDHFWPLFFCQLCVNLSPNYGSDGHFEELSLKDSKVYDAKRKQRKKYFFLKKEKKYINKKFGIRINYAQLISFYDKSGLRKIRF
jgi:hypothetical protein